MTPNTSSSHDDTISPQTDNSDSQGVTNDEVLVISLGTEIECPGMMQEQKVLTWEQENKRRKVKYQTNAASFDGQGNSEIQEKRTRFSLSTDQESIGNTCTGKLLLTSNFC